MVLPREDTAPEPPAHSVSDVNECRRYPGRLCGHKCENTQGSYYCSCSAGFRLSADGRSCEGQGRGGAGRASVQAEAPAHSRRRVSGGRACQSQLLAQLLLGPGGAAEPLPRVCHPENKD